MESSETQCSQHTHFQYRPIHTVINASMLQQYRKRNSWLEFTSTQSPPASPALPPIPTSWQHPEENNVMTPAAEARSERWPGSLTVRWQSLRYNISNKSAAQSRTHCSFCFYFRYFSKDSLVQAWTLHGYVACTADLLYWRRMQISLFNKPVNQSINQSIKMTNYMTHVQQVLNFSEATANAVIKLRFDYDTTTIRLRRIARACFHSTRAKNEHVLFVAVVS